MYQVRKTSRSEFIPLRNLRYHVRTWGQPQARQAPLVLVHGWMDVGASFQFMVDALQQERHIIAPDWRGFGLTDAGGADNYFFPDYLADLDFLIDHFSPDAPVDLLGHSMGGNIAMVYAGVRPARIRRLVNLEGFGLAATHPKQAAGRYAKWMDELKGLHRGELQLRPYDSLAGVVARLMKTNPRLARDDAGRHKAEWLAQHWAREEAQPDGTSRWQVLGEPAHKISNAQLYRVDEVLDIYRRITAPVLAVEATDNSLQKWWGGSYTLEQYHERLKSVPQVQTAVIDDAGHMLHHDQPGALARLIEDFLGKH
ncbi:MAG: alpha/beta hydrolase [Pseudomonadota bacterium]